MAILSILLTVVILVTSVLMVLIVLIQRPKQEGLGAAFGGGALDSALGAHTTDVLQKFTTYLGIAFFVSAIGLAMVKTREFRASAASNVLEGVEAKQPALPGLPPEISNIPGIEGLSVETPAPAEGAPAPETTTEAPAPAPAPAADAAKEKAAPAPESPAPAPALDAAKEKAAPAPESPAPAADAPAPPADGKAPGQ